MLPVSDPIAGRPADLRPRDAAGSGLPPGMS